ncbi:uncharacterized protein LOC104855362 isoform X1 [Fukomys damarensis]|uniref:uncharacterized protein LOC104855362 isoform X1 n=1 Tax=Fukomys damarensis TaxID=885580 RepID=UPI001455CDF0|nr:uncharacterized protein LOC104855362 isoform X1 [Fukomys damarensis]
MSLPSVFLMPLGLWLSFSPTQVQVGQISGSCDTWPGHWGALGQKTEELGALMSHLPHHPAVRSWLLEQSREDASGQEEEAYPVETEQGLAHPRALPQLAPVLCHWATPIFSTRAVPPSSRHPFLVFPFRLSESFCLPGTAILLPQPSQCLDYRCAPPRPASLLSFRCPKQRSQPEISRSPWAADPVPQAPLTPLHWESNRGSERARNTPRTHSRAWQNCTGPKLCTSIPALVCANLTPACVWPPSAREPPWR